MSTYEAWRSEFEAWANGRCELHLTNPAGRYSSTATQFAWEAYQAGRAATPAAGELATLQAGLQAAAPAVLPEPVPSGMCLVNTGALQMVINALRRDAEEGKAVRGEMADELLAAACLRSGSTPPVASTTDQSRVPLTDAQIKEGRNALNDDPDDRPEPWAFREGVKFAEPHARHHTGQA